MGWKVGSTTLDTRKPSLLRVDGGKNYWGIEDWNKVIGSILRGYRNSEIWWEKQDYLDKLSG